MESLQETELWEKDPFKKTVENKKASLGSASVLKVGENSHSHILFLLSLHYRGKISSVCDLWVLHY